MGCSHLSISQVGLSLGSSLPHPRSGRWKCRPPTRPPADFRVLDSITERSEVFSSFSIGCTCSALRLTLASNEQSEKPFQADTLVPVPGRQFVFTFTDK